MIYEAHVRGLTKQLRAVPPHLRGTYAGLAHPATVAHLTELGVTAVELLPVQAFASERRLVKQGLANYWGYNTVGFFAPHMRYATLAAQRGGPQAVLSEFKGMVRLLHEAGIEVILDVVYNHTAEEGLDGPTLGFRGIDNSTYYRQDDSGRYLDTTGCGNSLDFSRPAVQRLVLDSVRYWANEVQVDGFRFDLAVTLGRDGGGGYSPESPLLAALRDDPALAGVKLIAEPWDVGLGGWQTGGFPDGWSEWNDRYRDTVRDFWLTDLHVLRNDGYPRTSVGAMADGLAGSSSRFSEERGPLASIDFVTAHDGFTLADLTAYNQKHNLGNGESNRDGTDANHSFNFGAEGPTQERADPRLTAPGDAQPARDAAALGGRADAGGGRRARPHPAGQQQPLLPRRPAHVGELDALRLAARPARGDEAAHRAPPSESGAPSHALRPARRGAAGRDRDALVRRARVADGPGHLERAGEPHAAVPGPRGAGRDGERNSTLVVLHGEESEKTVVLPEHDGIPGTRCSGRAPTTRRATRSPSRAAP